MSECKYCHAGIEWAKVEGRNIPKNPDGSPHRCKTAEPKALTGATVGKLSDYNPGSATFVVRGGKQKTFALMPSIAKDFESKGFNLPPDNHPDVWLGFAVDDNHLILPGYQQVQRPEWAAEISDPTGGEIKKPEFVRASELPREEKKDCTSSEPLAAPAPDKTPSRDLLLSMVNNPDTYWRAKALMDIQAHEDIREQVAWKNWKDAVELAMQHRPMAENLADIFPLAEQIHQFIQGKIGGVQ